MQLNLFPPPHCSPAKLNVEEIGRWNKPDSQHGDKTAGAIANGSQNEHRRKLLTEAARVRLPRNSGRETSCIPEVGERRERQDRTVIAVMTVSPHL